MHWIVVIVKILHIFQDMLAKLDSDEYMRKTQPTSDTSTYQTNRCKRNHSIMYAFELMHANIELHTCTLSNVNWWQLIVDVNGSGWNAVHYYTCFPIPVYIENKVYDIVARQNNKDNHETRRGFRRPGEWKSTFLAYRKASAKKKQQQHRAVKQWKESITKIKCLQYLAGILYECVATTVTVAETCNLHWSVIHPIKHQFWFYIASHHTTLFLYSHSRPSFVYSQNVCVCECVFERMHARVREYYFSLCHDAILILHSFTYTIVLYRRKKTMATSNAPLKWCKLLWSHFYTAHTVLFTCMRFSALFLSLLHLCVVVDVCLTRDLTIICKLRHTHMHTCIHVTNLCVAQQQHCFDFFPMQKHQAKEWIHKRFCSRRVNVKEYGLKTTLSHNQFPYDGNQNVWNVHTPQRA